jgi:hypothetical protein
MKLSKYLSKTLICGIEVDDLPDVLGKENGSAMRGHSSFAETRLTAR